MTKELQEAAREIARGFGHVTTDDLRRFAELRKIPFGRSEISAANNMFRGKSWRAVGSEPSSIPRNKGRRITKWTNLK